jgi:glycosyltransferase involved in cell wall biosynthesis
MEQLGAFSSLRAYSINPQKHAMLPQRIVYVLKVFPKISETFIAEELAELRRRGIELRILSLLPARAGIRHDIVASAGLEQLTSYEPTDFSGLVQEFRPQLLHAHFATEATAVAIELATEHGIPFTFTAHGYDIHRKAPSDFGARAAAAKAVVTVSKANADYIGRTFGVPPSRIRIIPCGVDTQRFQPGSVNGLMAETPLIVCVARQVAVKNLGLLLDACSLLAKRGTNFRCVLVGDGPCQGELEEKRAQLGLSEIVEMPGAAEQADVLKWWQRAAVGVLTSDNEGMPVSLMEAAACGVPVAATAVGGVPELIADGTTGLLVRPNDAGALAAALGRLLDEPGLRARLGMAARRHAEEKFSVHGQVDQLLALWSEVLCGESTPTVFVRDLFNSTADPELPSLAFALDPVEARAEFKRRLPRLSGVNGKLRLKAIRVIRHKPGRRCVIEYDVRVERPDLPTETVTLIGKTRVRRFGNEGYRMQERIWNAGFDSASADGISVPEPIGVIPRFRMWFQRKVPGETATRLLAMSGGVELASRIAVAIHKLHKANVPTERQHLMADELRILHECLAKVQQQKPEWSARLERVLTGCDLLGASVPEPRLCGIHRDFYSAQVVFHEGRLYLIDFDLYCLGDPGLDIGNFIGHITEQGLRETGDARAWTKQERALEEKFVELAGEQCRLAVVAYTTLTLVRHIYLSTQFTSRQAFTVPLLELCEQRLGLV